MAVTYTTHTLVGDRLSQISSDLTQAKIEGAILQAEGIIDSVMQLSGRVAGGSDYTFSGAVHGLVQDTATALAAYICLNYDITEFVTSTAASLVADLLWSEADRGLAILSDPNVQYWIKKV